MATSNFKPMPVFLKSFELFSILQCSEYRITNPEHDPKLTVSNPDLLVDLQCMCSVPMNAHIVCSFKKKDASPGGDINVRKTAILSVYGT